MYQFILIIHVFVCLGLIAMVLLHQGKGSDIGASFGSGASNTVFGSQGSGTFMFKITATLAAVFFAGCLILGAIASKNYKSSYLLAKGAPTSTSNSE